MANVEVVLTLSLRDLANEEKNLLESDCPELDLSLDEDDDVVSAEDLRDDGVRSAAIFPLSILRNLS